MTIVTNPTANSITVMISGITYTVAGNSTLSGVPLAFAELWRDRIHNFLTLSPENSEVITTLADDGVFSSDGSGTGEADLASVEVEAPVVPTTKPGITAVEEEVEMTDEEEVDEE